jgi:hypothetical protein
VSGDVPHPPSYGKLLYSAGLTEALAATGAQVVGVGLVRESDPRPLPATQTRWHAVEAPRRGRIRSLGSRYPSMTHATVGLRPAVAALLAGGEWDVVVVDHLETAWVADLAAEGPPVVYVAHNHEASVRTAAARASAGRADRRAVLRLEAAKAARLERRLIARAALVVAITDGDAARFGADARDTRVVVLTPGYAGPRVESRTIDARTPRQATIVTSLDWHVKQANLQALLAVADPVFAAAGVRLLVAGDAPSGLLDIVARTCRATTMLGRVDDLGPLLADTRVAIVAEPLGGGFKLKVLDFVHRRVPIVAIEGSIDGVPLTHPSELLTFPDASALACGVVDVVDDFDRLNRLQRAAFARCDGSFDWAERGVRLAAALRDVRVGHT